MKVYKQFKQELLFNKWEQNSTGNFKTNLDSLK